MHLETKLIKKRPHIKVGKQWVAMEPAPVAERKEGDLLLPADDWRLRVWKDGMWQHPGDFSLVDRLT